MIALIDDQRGVHGVEPICKVLPIAPSTCFDHEAKRDAVLLPEIKRVHKAQFGVFGVQKLWRRLGARRFHCGALLLCSLKTGSF